ncbi:MAG: type I polyketide synthase, partial [Catenulispora sp.]|nr:type I polyketide synthase [Catenulispora sp.]
ELLHEPQPWPRSARVRRAGESSFGISGTNAHVIVEEPPAGVVHVAESADGDLAFPLVVSGIDETAVHAQARHWADWLEARQPAALRHVAYTSAVSRTHFDSRAVVFARSIPDAVEELRSLSPGAGPGAGAGVARGRTAFVFPGQGAQWLGMGRELLEHSAVFRDAVTECDAALSPLTGWSVLAVLRGDESAVPDMTRVDVVQCSLFAMYVGLAAVWRAWGVEPSAVVGHSQGEVAAAVVSGALSVPDGARVVAARARALWTHSVGGAMGLVERPSEEVAERIAASGYGSALSVAVVNSARSTVVAGDEDAVVRFLAEMEASGAFCQRVDVDYASHSARIDVLLPELRESLSGIVARRAAVPFYSSLTGEILSGPELDGEYWCRNLREPVRFDRALERLRADGFGVFVEASPHPVLGIVLAQACDGDGSAVVVGSLRRGAGGVDQLWQAVGALFVRGFPVDWKRVLGSGGARKTDVPTYAFQRQRFWLDGVVSTRIPPRTVSATPTLAASPEPRPAVSATSAFRAPLDPLPAEHPWFGTTTTLAGTATHLFLGRLSLDDHPWLADHVVGGTVFVPGAGLIDAALWAARTAGCGAVTDLTLLEPVVLSPDRALRLQATVGDPDARGRRPFALHSQGEDTDEPYAWQQHITGECLPQAGAHVAAPQEDLQAWPVPDTKTLDVEAFYARASANGLDYGRSFQGLRELSCRDGVYYARVSLPESLDPAHYGLHPALFDAALQVVVAGLLESGAGPGPLVPFIWSG